MKIESLRELNVEEFKDLYTAKHQRVKALPKMAKAANAPALRQGFEKHLKETKAHVERLETILTELGESLRGKKCKAMEGLVEEGSDAIEEDAEPDVKDAALIAAAQRVKHYDSPATLRANLCRVSRRDEGRKTVAVDIGRRRNDRQRADQTRRE